MKKWIIGGGIVGLIGVVSTYTNLSTFFANLAGGTLSKGGQFFYTAEWILFPFGFVVGCIDPNFTPFFFWKMFTIASILNIGLYAFLGYIVGRIVRGIRCRFK